MDLADYRVTSICSLVEQRGQIAIIEFLTLQNLALGKDARCEVHSHIQGALNKLYKTDTDSGTVLMRVSPSVDSRHRARLQLSNLLARNIDASPEDRCV